MAKAKTVVDNKWTFVLDDYTPDATAAQTSRGITPKTYNTAGFHGNSYWTERRPMLKAVTYWRDILDIMDHKANRDKIRKFIASEEKSVVAENVAENKVAETTASNKQNNSMSAEMIAQIAAIVKATLASEED